MIVHLVTSTVVLIIAMLAARFLPLTARTRHAVLLAGLAKFALPSQPIAELLRLAQIDDVVPQPLRIFGGAAPVAATPQSTTNWLLLVWAAIATILFARWLLLRARTVSAALRTSTPASPREVHALAEARRIMNVDVAIDIVRSPIAEAPAVLRVVRPVIVMANAESLDDRELQAVLCHECAHVARRDNLLSMLTALAGALLWFHPLVWLALREIAVAREEACDEAVAEQTNETGAYLDALTKICRAVLAPRVTAVACMASPNLKRRMEHLMSYERIRKSALSHRAVFAAALLAIFSATALVAAVTATGTVGKPYKLDFAVSAVSDGVEYEFTIAEAATGVVVSRPRLTLKPNVAGNVALQHQHASATRTFRIRANGTPQRGEIDFTVDDEGKTLQTERLTYDAAPRAAKNEKFTGAPISISLKDADIRDVLHTFGQLTGLEMVIAPDVDARISVEFRDTPWDQALYDIAHSQGLTVRIANKRIHVSK